MSDLSGITHNYLDQLTLALTGFPEGEVLKVAGILIKGLNEGTIYVAGNGGSASTASHMATDLGVCSLRRNNPLRIVSLVDNTAVLVNAVEEAKNMEITTISVTGFDGGTLRNISDFNIHIETAIGSYGIVEDIHSTISHMLTEIIRSPR